jgi:preprotein translocase subunit SecD
MEGGLMARVMVVVAMVLIPLGCDGPDGGKVVAPLEDGVYAVAASAESRETLRPASAGEVLLVETRKYVRGGAGAPPSYVLVETEGFVPLRLRGRPEKVTGDDGRDRILISLDETGAAKLREFTRAVSDRQGQVVVVLGGEIVTRHKVREPITGGGFAISC